MLATRVHCVDFKSHARTIQDSAELGPERRRYHFRSDASQMLPDNSHGGTIVCPAADGIPESDLADTVSPGLARRVAKRRKGTAWRGTDGWFYNG
jgi:hypothetical protein